MTSTGSNILDRRAIVLAVLAGFFFHVAVADRSAASPSGDALSVGWTHVAPELDGRCDDDAYGESLTLVEDATGAARSQVRIVHDRGGLFLCAAGLAVPEGGELRLRLSTAREPGEELGAAELELRLDPAGDAGAGRPDGAGAFTAVGLDDGDVTVAVAEDDFEARVALDWLGGYSRRDALWAALVDDAGDVVASWPSEADGEVPSSWGELALEPLYPAGIAAGSLFLDGRGHAVLPFDPALNPAGELTVEAWVKVTLGDCGTVLGNRRESSFWLGVCGPAAFTHGGSDAVARGQERLRDGWHHLAMVMNAGGERLLYVDGGIDRHLGAPPHPEEDDVPEPVHPGASDAPPRVGSDRDLGGEDGALHGHVRELRLWNRARSQAEIVADAFRNLTDPQPGLVGVWPLTGSLQDVIGGRDAGLVGLTALAREGLDVAAFPDPPPPPRTSPRPKSPADPAPWEAVIPHASIIETPIAIDGACRTAEYRGAARVRLEPERGAEVRLLLGPDALYLCAPALFGGLRPEDGLTLWLHHPEGVGANGEPTLPLRLSFDPEGGVETALWSEEEETFLPTTDVEIEQVIDTADRFRPQEDIAEMPTPWWKVEARIPAEVFGSPREGDELALAVEARMSVAEEILGQPRRVTREASDNVPTSAGWPESFIPEDLSSWGDTDVQPLEDDDPPFAGFFNPSLAKICIPEDPASHWPAPLTAPTKDTFHDAGCYESFGDCYVNYGYPAVALMYCASKMASFTTDKDNKWPGVDEDHDVVYAEGTLKAIYISRQDAPIIHDSHDVDMVVELDDAYTYLNIGHKKDLKVEHESEAFPANEDHPELSVRPTVGDHVTLVGHWIFDCGHGAKTEIHPFVYFESDRLETRRTGWGTEHEVTSASVWMTSEAGHLSGGPMTEPFAFRLALPEGDGLPFLRVVHGAPSAVSATYCNDTVFVTIDPPTETGSHRFELVAGRIRQGGPPAPPAFRLTFDALTVHNDWDYSTNDGDWTMDASVNGRWRNLFWDKGIDDGDGSDQPIGHWASRSIDLLGERDLAIYVNAWDEDDDGTHGAGNEGQADAFDFQGNGRGKPVIVQPLAAGSGTLSASHNDKNEATWEMGFTVTPLAANDQSDDLAAPTIPAAQGALALNEPAAPPVQIEVPGPTEPTDVTALAGFMTQTGLGLAEYHFFEPDVDSYQIALDDFADLTAHVSADPAIEPLFNLDLIPRSRPLRDQTPTSACPVVPPELFDVLGAKQYSAIATATVGQAAGPYSVDVATSYRVVPADPGEPPLGQTEAPRTFDLTDNPSEIAAEALHVGCGYGSEPTSAFNQSDPTASLLRNESAWAWQHVPGDVDLYRVVFPRPQPDPDPTAPPCAACSSSGLEPGDISSSFAGFLELRAEGMHLEVVTPGFSYSGDDVLKIPNLGNLPLPEAAEGGGKAELLVEVGSRAEAGDERCAYRLEAVWKGSLYLKYGQPGCPWGSGPEQSGYCVSVCQQIVASSSLPEWWWTKGPGLPDPPPWRGWLDLTAGQGFTHLHLADSAELGLVLSTAADTHLKARLYDPSYVLVGESLGLDAGEQDTAAAPTGLLPAAVLSAEGLQAGAYLLQVEKTKSPGAEPGGADPSADPGTDTEVEVGLGGWP